MSTQTFSFILRCSRDPQTGNYQIRVTRVDTGEEIALKEGSFLLRVSLDTYATIVRYRVRDTASRREAYAQSGLAMLDFVKACLLKGADASSSSGELEEDQSESNSGTEIPPDSPGETSNPNNSKKSR